MKDSESNPVAGFGVVVIGRNEGDRLRGCLESLIAEHVPVVYVDSGSTDDSVNLATSLGCRVVHLSTEIPFTAGRARNTGFDALLCDFPDLEFVQFIDGDCRLQPSWLSAARRSLAENPRVAIVCGRRRERYPEATIYNRLCDMEWNTPVGEAAACGGDFLVRTDAFRQVKGFDPSVIAGEEPEMCFRLRRLGWAICRLPLEMTIHDAAMTSFWQYWKRARRSGHAYAQGAAIHWRKAGSFQKKELLSILFWTLVPILITALFIPLSIAAVAILPLCYGYLWLKILRHKRNSGMRIGDALLYATYIPIGKFPQAQGICDFVLKLISRRQFELIEYK